MSEGPNRWMPRLPETIDQGVDTPCGCNCYCLCLRNCSLARVRSGFVMIVRASGLGMGVGRFSRPWRGVGVITMLDEVLDTTRRGEVPLGAGVLRLLVSGVAVGVCVDRRCAADWVEVTRWLISARRELFSEDEGVEFWPWIVEGKELSPCEKSLSPTGTETHLLAGGSWEFPKGPHCCWFWRLARLPTFHTTGVMSGWGLWECIVQYRCSMLRKQEQLPVHAYATAGEVDSYLSGHGGFRQKREAQCRPR